MNLSLNIKCGVDIIEISRIKDAIENIGEKFLDKVFTEKEIEYCESKKNQKFQHYAARFAAKEAIFKAISESIGNKYEMNWKDYEVLNDENNRPFINIDKKYKKNIENMDISISHCKEYAVANVAILFREDRD